MVQESSENPEQPRLDELISLAEAVQISDLSPSHLRLLVTTGELWGIKLGRNWFTTAKAVDEYLRAGHKPGPKPKQP